MSACLNMCHRIIRFYIRLKSFVEEFGICSAVSILLPQIMVKLIRLDLFRNAMFVKKHSAIRKFIEYNYSKVILADRECELSTEEKILTFNISPIWVCWWQGESNMPPIVDICYKNIIKHAGSHPVILITELNYLEYVDVPDYVLEKLATREISITFFSDLLRVSLLTSYGGIWMDATLFITKNLDCIVSNSSFFSIKNISYSKEFVTQYRWGGFFLVTNKVNFRLFRNARRFLLEYIKEHNILLDYLLMNYCFDFQFDNDDSLKQILEDVSSTNPDLHSLRGILNEKFNKELYERMLERTHVFKLSYKGVFSQKTSVGDLTFYGYLMNLG